MNKYQKRKSREIKSILRGKAGRGFTYKQARWLWRFSKRFQWCSPCEDCDTWGCKKVGKPIAYCPERR